MECLGIMTEECEYWNNLNSLFSNEKNVDFMTDLLNSFPLPHDQNIVSNSPFLQESIMNNNEGSNYWCGDIDSSINLPFLSQDSDIDLPIPAMVSSSDSSLMSINNLFMKDRTNERCLPVSTQREDVSEDKRNNLMENPKKRPRAQVHVEKNKRSTKKRNNTKKDRNDNVVENQALSNCSSDDDSNNSSKDVQANGKTRASRGSATDPQSIYARKRRERINERLKVLQNIVPNGTKVDISTMLEEAVQYVKFLQLQIKMLSSDDQWMYAPLAYNGMNFDLHNLNINI
ncbi:hypothetical protein ACFE04_000971 [Oxalis oulophora]